MWWKQWCHAREEGRGCELCWVELCCAREPGRDSAAASLLFARGETDRLKTARGHNGLASGRSLTHWTFDEHKKIRWVRVVTVARNADGVFCLPFCLWLKRRTVILGDRRCRKRRKRDKGYMQTRLLLHRSACQLAHSVLLWHIAISF